MPRVAPKHSMLCQYLLLSVSLVLFKLSDVTFQEAQLVGQSLPVQSMDLGGYVSELLVCWELPGLGQGLAGGGRGL